MVRARRGRSAVVAACAAVVLVMVVTPDAGPRASGQQADAYREARTRMVRDQIEGRGVRDVRVLEAMRRVPRHLFVPESLRAQAYEDYPLPIGHDQSISQPYIVAYMTEALARRPRPPGARDRHRVGLPGRGARGDGRGGLHD